MRRYRFSLIAAAAVTLVLAVPSAAQAVKAREVRLEGTQGNLYLSAHKIVDREEIPGTGEVLFRFQNASSVSGVVWVMYYPGPENRREYSQESHEWRLHVGETVILEVPAVTKEKKRTVTIKVMAAKKPRK